MRILLLADIHANWPALKAISTERFDVCLVLGDLVDYGLEPAPCIDWVRKHATHAVRGNHDHAIASPSETMNAEAQAAIEWTRGRLGAAQRRFLSGLPLTHSEDDRLYVHSEASNPARWRYVKDAADAARSLIATTAHVTFCGHIHQPALYSMSSTAKMTSFVPISEVPVQLLKGRQWLAVLGSVGQPRDRDPAACFVLFETVSREITYCRVPYGVEAAAKRIRDNGLPLWLADRLAAGR